MSIKGSGAKNNQNIVKTYENIFYKGKRYNIKKEIFPKDEDNQTRVI